MCRASNIFSRSCLQRWMTLRVGNACRRAFQEHWSNCAHWMWAELSLHIQCAFDVTVTCLNKWLFCQRLDRMWRITLSDGCHVAAMYNDYMLELYHFTETLVDNTLKTRAANLCFFVFMALSTTEVTCVTLGLSKK